MGYKFLPDIALADIAFEAQSSSANGLFESCGQALSDTMVDPRTLKSRVKKTVTLASGDLDRLLYDFLTELIILKDVDSLLFKEYDVKLDAKTESLTARLGGEKIDRKRHGLRNDVKAVTMHMFGVKREGNKWMATVVLDI